MGIGSSLSVRSEVLDGSAPRTSREDFWGVGGVEAQLLINMMYVRGGALPASATSPPATGQTARWSRTLSAARPAAASRGSMGPRHFLSAWSEHSVFHRACMTPADRGACSQAMHEPHDHHLIISSLSLSFFSFFKICSPPPCRLVFDPKTASMVVPLGSCCCRCVADDARTAA